MEYFIFKRRPENWDGKYLLKCKHCRGRSESKYLMYCNLVKEMPNNRVKVKVFGYRCSSIAGERIRYIHRSRLIKEES